MLRRNLRTARGTPTRPAKPRCLREEKAPSRTPAPCPQYWRRVARRGLSWVSLTVVSTIRTRGLSLLCDQRRRIDHGHVAKLRPRESGVQQRLREHRESLAHPR